MEEINKWWEDQHNSANRELLSGTNIGTTLKHLELTNPLDKTILEIGVGLHILTNQLLEKNIVDVMDISKKGLELSKARNKYLYPTSTPKINEYDLIISHLVTQHIDNKTLNEHLKKCIPALKKTGRFVMQYYETKEDTSESLEAQKWGGVGRTFPVIKQFVEDNGGTIVTHKYLEEYEWGIIYIERK